MTLFDFLETTLASPVVYYDITESLLCIYNLVSPNYQSFTLRP